MLEDKIEQREKRIKSNEIRVYLEPEYDLGIKPGGLINLENLGYEA